MTRHEQTRKLEDALVVLKNSGTTLLGNTQESDIDWFGRVLFESSNVGVGDVRTVPWVVDRREWEYLRLRPQQLMGDGPRRLCLLTARRNSFHFTAGGFVSF